MVFQSEPKPNVTKPPGPPFEFYMPEHPRYRCCCQNCHVRTGSITISIICMIFCAFFFIKGVVFLARHPDEVRAASIIAVVIAILCAFICIALLIGVIKEIRYLLIPYLIVQALVVFVAFAMAILCIVYMVTGESSILGPADPVDTDPQALATTQEGQWWLKVFATAAACIYALAFGLGIWFFIVVVLCFRWIKEKKAHLRQNDAYVPLKNDNQA